MYREDGERMQTWNPHPGCDFKCYYCFGPAQYARFSKCAKCRAFKPHFHLERMQQKFKPNKTYFVESLGDPSFIPPDIFQQILNHLAEFPETRFMFQSKNPRFFADFKYPENIWLGTTIETDIDDLARVYSSAPSPTLRFSGLLWTKQKTGRNIYITFEPLLVFNQFRLMQLVRAFEPNEVYVGLDNHAHHLPEPSKEMQLRLVHSLEDLLGLENVHRKTLGLAWWEKR